MDVSRWREIEGLYHQARELPPELRAALLRTVSDAGVRREVESLLAQDPSAAPVFAQPPVPALPGMPRVGDSIGPYEILAIAGVGGMATVFRARDTRLGRMVAMKLIHPEFSAMPEFRRRLRREAKAVSALSHPRVCRVFDIGKFEDSPYIVMEFAEGEPLSDVTAKGLLTRETALRFARQIASGLVAAHVAGIVHRDLKPANVMVRGDDITILDFGLARYAPEGSAASVITLPDAVMGTPAWMAPEQIAGEACDARTDIHALGLLLRHMIADMPPELERVVQRCLAADPAARWQTAAELERQLARDFSFTSRRPQWMAVVAAAFRRKQM